MRCAFQGGCRKKPALPPFFRTEQFANRSNPDPNAQMPRSPAPDSGQEGWKSENKRRKVAGLVDAGLPVAQLLRFRLIPACWQMALLAFSVLFWFLLADAAGGSVLSLLGANLLRRPHRFPRAISEEEITTVLDRFGEMPHLRMAEQAIEQAHPVVAVLLSNQSLLVGLVSDRADRLLVPVGAQQLKLLNARSGLALLLTGAAGDCRFLVRHAFNHSLHHEFTFGCPPSARYLARELGDFLVAHMQRNLRPLACHAFLLQPRTNDSDALIYEIAPSGTVQLVRAGAGGKGAAQIRDYFAHNLSSLESIDEVREFLQAKWASAQADEQGRPSQTLSLFDLSQFPRGRTHEDGSPPS